MASQSPSDLHPYTVERQPDGRIVLRRTRLPRRVTVSTPSSERIAITVVLLLVLAGGIFWAGRLGAIGPMLLDNMYAIAAVGLTVAGLFGAWFRHRRRPRLMELDPARRELRLGARAIPFGELSKVVVYPYRTEVDGEMRKIYEVYVRARGSRIILGLFDARQPATRWAEELEATIESTRNGGADI